jgi:sec-independent protein translocase protein TatB
VFGVNASEFIVLLAVAALVLGPERLPQYTQQLTRLVRELRRMAQGASEQVRAELGPEFDEVDWRKLDPRQYDPRRIVREALEDVFDPEDPLGLKETRVDKPVSPGGPSRELPQEPTAAPAAEGPVSLRKKAPPETHFDPDAT